MILINESKCIGCGACVKECPRQIINIVNKKAEYTDSRCLNCGHCYAVCPANAISMPDFGDFKEDKIQPKEESSLSTEVFLNYLKSRRSIRQYAKKDVEKEKLEKIIEALRFSPTSRNCEEISAFVIQKVTEPLLDKLFDWLDIQMDINLENDVFVEMSKNYKNDIAEYRKDKKNNYFTFNAPCIIGLVIDTDKRKGPKANYDAGIAAANMEAAATSLGLGILHCGMFTWLNDNKEFRNYMGMSENQELMIGLLVGYKAPGLKYQRIPPRKEGKVHWL